MTHHPVPIALTTAGACLVSRREPPPSSTSGRIVTPLTKLYVRSKRSGDSARALSSSLAAAPKNRLNVLPRELGMLKKLRVLRLQSNKLRTIPCVRVATPPAAVRPARFLARAAPPHETRPPSSRANGRALRIPPPLVLRAHARTRPVVATALTVVRRRGCPPAVFRRPRSCSVDR